MQFISMLLICLGLILLDGCSTPGQKLPLVQKDDPIIDLVPDHLDRGELPR